MTSFLANTHEWTNDIRFLAGKLNTVADHLSRPSNVPLGAAYRLEDLETIAAFEFGAKNAQLAAINTVALELVDHSKLAKAQSTCPDVASHRAGNHANGLNLVDHEFSPGTWLFCDVSDGKKARPLVPKEFRQVIFRMFHQLNHPGNKPTLKAIVARYFWPDMRKDVAHYVETCPDCLVNKIKPYNAPKPAHRPIIAKRFSDLMLDICGPLPESQGMRYQLTIVVRTTRCVEAIPMPVATSESCDEAFIENWVARFGIPSHATSDNGNTFIGNMWTELQKCLGTVVSYTPLYTGVLSKRR